MRFKSLTKLLAVLTICLQTGCLYGPYGGAYSRNYYGTPYGGAPAGYGTPTYMGTPMQTLTPGQQYYPGPISPGTIQSTPPSTFGPGGVQPLTPLDGPGGENRMVPVPEGSIFNGNPSTYNSTASSTKTTMNELLPAGHEAGLAPIGDIRSVREEVAGFAEPAPADPFPAQPPGALPEPVSAVPMGSADPYFPQPTAASAPMASPALDEPRFEAPIPAASANPFPALDTLESIPAAAPAQSPPAAPAQSEFVDPFSSGYKAQKVTPFAHDRQYRWLKGVVTRQQNGAWGIIYSDKPQPDDRLVGQVTLAPSPLLGKLQEGDVVQVAGQVDPVARDSRGKAVYLVSDVKRVVVP